MEKYIFHVDMDAFYASVEELDKPWLRDKPMVVAGSSGRGVITTANYVARKYGLHSAMPMFMARRLCPQVQVVPVDKAKYSKYSAQIFEILQRYSKTIEKVSLDESYIEFSYLKDPLAMAQAMKKEVYDETGLTMSVGISYNKFLAKIGSDWNKPSGIKIIDKSMVPDILFDLPVRKVHGLGSRSLEKLDAIGVETIKDLYDLPLSLLEDYFGVMGKEVYYRIRGVDHRPVEPVRERKSLGMESTFKKDIDDLETLEKIMYSYARDLADGLAESGLVAKTFTVKLKDNDFLSQSRSYSLVEYTDSYEDIKRIALALLDELYGSRPYRLMGLTASSLVDKDFKQLSLF